MRCIHLGKTKYFDHTSLTYPNRLIYESGSTMDDTGGSISIEIIDSEEAFLALQDQWDALIEKSTNPSFFSTFLFVSTAWKHFRSETDRLFILVVRRDAQLVGIAPFRIGSEKVANNRLLAGIQVKVIRFIAEWGSGDKPVLVTTEDPEVIWDSIFQFLDKEFTRWDGIWLVEQAADSPVLNRRFFSRLWFFTRTFTNAPSFFISIAGTWEEFLTTRGKETYRTWKKDQKRLFNLPEGVVFQCVVDPGSIPEALKRFISIEQSGWKKDQDFSIGGSEKNKRFYEELLVQSAHKNMAAICLLTSGTMDIAGIIVYKYNRTVYAAQVTFSPKYAKYSPGMIINAEVIKSFFNTQYQEIDYLGFQRGNEKNSLKERWSTGSRQTTTIMLNKRNFRMWLYYR